MRLFHQRQPRAGVEGRKEGVSFPRNRSLGLRAAQRLRRAGRRQVADDARVWDVYAEYLQRRGHASTELECRRKALRCRQERRCAHGVVV